MAHRSTMKRYALYFSPPPGPLAETAARWLGRDAISGVSISQPNPEMGALTASARRYGFHATLKPPFRLAEGRSAEDLFTAVDVFAAGVRPFALEGLEVASIDRFLALVPIGATARLNTFAAHVVTAFDRFRAPLTEAERTRRNPERLTGRQRELLDLYGYPFVFDEFRFHMTLSDRLTAEQHEVLKPLAVTMFEPVLPRPFPVDALAVFAEGDDGVFHQVHRVPLG